MLNRTNKYVLLTGSDIGDRSRNLDDARKHISSIIGDVLRSSKVHETEPWGFESDTRFLNQALLINSHLGPEELLQSILFIEKKMGRKRNKMQWTSRLIDIDIISAEDLAFDSPELTIPHKNMQQREFVLIPLCEVAPNWMHPVLKKTSTELLSELNDVLAKDLI